MMTEQAFPVSPLMEMLGMFSVMAEQYVSNLGLPQCYEKGGGERIRVEKGFRRDGERRGDYLFAHYLSVEVENSSGHVVKEERWACPVGEEVKNGSLQLSEWALSNRQGNREQLKKRAERWKDSERGGKLEAEDK